VPQGERGHGRARRGSRRRGRTSRTGTGRPRWSGTRSSRPHTERKGRGRMTLASNLRENKAVYAVAGAGDFAVEKLREVPGQVDRYREQFREQVRETVERYRGEVSRYQERVDAKDLPGAAVAYATHVGTRAAEIIDELAERGRKVVN